MKPLSEDDKPFCDEASIEKARQQLVSSAIRINENIAFLVLSGSFNPVHTQHVHLLEVTKQHLEKLGWKIIAGFMAPSSEAYVGKKLGGHALSLNQRIMLCKLAAQSSDWISVCSKGELSSN
jgi:nicotinic acid mononucleotide adenylyltransferase